VADLSGDSKLRCSIRDNFSREKRGERQNSISSLSSRLIWAAIAGISEAIESGMV
jgi:hypothetical protein